VTSTTRKAMRGRSIIARPLVRPPSTFGLLVASLAGARRLGVFRGGLQPLNRVQARLVIAIVVLFVTGAVLSLASFLARTSG